MTNHSDADEINMLIAQLTDAWGSVAIACAKDDCAVGDGVDRQFQAPTLLAALRLAVAAVEEVGP